MNMQTVIGYEQQPDGSLIVCHAPSPPAPGRPFAFSEAERVPADRAAAVLAELHAQ